MLYSVEDSRFVLILGPSRLRVPFTSCHAVTPAGGCGGLAVMPRVRQLKFGRRPVSLTSGGGSSQRVFLVTRDARLGLTAARERRKHEIHRAR
jgi:hypothetical protein